MKLSELGLKIKPQTKYFEGGYVSFSTDEDELSFKIKICRIGSAWTYEYGVVKDRKHLDRLLSIKHLQEVIEA